MSTGGGQRFAWQLFDADPVCGRAVRDWIKRVIAAHACPVDADDAALVVSELFGNAVVHGPAGGQILVGHVLWEHGVRLLVCDGGGATSPQLRDPGGLAEDGRGLLVVEAISAQWDSFRTAGAQAVWCDLGQPLREVDEEAWAWLRTVLSVSPFTGPASLVMAGMEASRGPGGRSADPAGHHAPCVGLSPGIRSADRHFLMRRRPAAAARERQACR